MHQQQAATHLVILARSDPLETQKQLHHHLDERHRITQRLEKQSMHQQRAVTHLVNLARSKPPDDRNLLRHERAKLLRLWKRDKFHHTAQGHKDTTQAEALPPCQLRRCV
jgi:hypothetical protein